MKPTHNELSIQILKGGGGIREGETLVDAINRVADTAGHYKPHLIDKFAEYVAKRFICLASPVWSNMGFDITDKPVSCFLTQPQDSVYDIYKTLQEAALLTKGGGGVGVHVNAIRHRGSPISNGGQSDGIVPWMKGFGSMFSAVSQGSNRRGAGAAYFDIESPDFEEALRFRRHNDTLHLGVNITDSFIEKCDNGDPEARRKWELLMKERAETGEPFICFIDRMNRAKPAVYGDEMLNGSNICSEITTLTNEKYTGTCVLSSLNLAKYDEWPEDLVEVAVEFLDAVNQHFIEKAEKEPGLEKAVAYAKKFKSLGLGVLGWHTYLQQRMIPWDSFQAMQHNNMVFKKIKEDADKARDGHAHLLAIAPTRTNALIANQVSQGIQPITANTYVDKAAKAKFVWRNRLLEGHMQIDKEQAWKEIEANKGSVQGLDHIFSKEVQEVFKTFVEINQVAVLKQADQRQKYICQSQSLNLAFTNQDSAKTIHDVHWYAATQCKYLKTMYYCNNQASVKASYTDVNECLACDG